MFYYIGNHLNKFCSVPISLDLEQNLFVNLLKNHVMKKTILRSVLGILVGVVVTLISIRYLGLYRMANVPWKNYVLGIFAIIIGGSNVLQKRTLPEAMKDFFTTISFGTFLGTLLFYCFQKNLTDKFGYYWVAGYAVGLVFGFFIKKIAQGINTFFLEWQGSDD